MNETHTPRMQSSAKQRTRLQLIFTVGLIVVGLLLIGFFGRRAVTSYQEVQYIRQQGLDQGTASLDAIRPWMTIRFVAVAYAVPEEYLYGNLDIPFKERDADLTLREINRRYDLGPTERGQELVILAQVKAAINAYRADPVVTGLHDVRPWMSIRYIANSTGVSAETIAEQLKIPANENVSRPLEMLSEELQYPGGARRLVEDVEEILAKSEALP